MRWAKPLNRWRNSDSALESGWRLKAFASGSYPGGNSLSSGRMTYLFFSADNLIRLHNPAERSVRETADAARSYEDGKFRQSDFVTVKLNLTADVEITKMSIQSHFGYDDPKEMKRITGLKPLRAWKLSFIKESAVLALLSEAAVAMARYELEPTLVTVMKKGKKTKEERRPSAESTIWSLGHLTLCRIIEKGCRKRAVSATGTLFHERFSLISEAATYQNMLLQSADCTKSQPEQRKISSWRSANYAGSPTIKWPFDQNQTYEMSRSG